MFAVAAATAARWLLLFAVLLILPTASQPSLADLAAEQERVTGARSQDRSA